MFTGIIQAIGQITELTPLKGGDDTHAGLRLRVDAGTLDLSDVQLGDSIALSGACMTVIRKLDHFFWVDVSRESLDKTCQLNQLGYVNLEKALRLHDYLGGHLVTGHVDAIGKITQLQAIGESTTLQVAVPAEIAAFMAYKGSVVINGVSLTINEVLPDDTGCLIRINLIPHTLDHTTFRYAQAFDAVNVEIDLIARYVARQLEVTSRTINH